jgi:Peptidase S46
MRFRERKFTAAALSVVFMFSMLPASIVRADEGMYTLDKIAALPLAKKGLKISATDIYNPAGGGLSEAVVRLSIGCSAEFVSPDGLILTNHHCGIDGLTSASTVEHNYAEIGYKASSRAEELPAENYSINIPLKSLDITSQVLTSGGTSDAAGIKTRTDQIQKDEETKMGPGVTVQIQALNSGLMYYMFDYATINDIRIVYAPPYSVGQFGGDPDNFEWTRHGGDFTFMRAYVGKDGKPAAYSKDNVPYHPKKFLSVSMDGVKENDFTMILGYPGGTNRYRESYSVAYNQDVQLPFTVDFLRAQAEALEAVGRTNAAKRVALQSEVFGLYNSLKAEDGGVQAMRHANLVARKQADEAKLQTWVAQDPSRARYGDALNGLRDAYTAYGKTASQDVVLRGFANLAPVGFTFAAISGQADKGRLREAIPEVLKSEPIANRETFKFLLRKAAELPADQRIPAIEKRFGSLSADARIAAEDDFARKAFEGESFTTQKGLSALLDMSADQLRASTDPLIGLVGEIGPSMGAAFARQQQLGTTASKYRPTFMEGMFMMKGNSNPYPDANFTQRFTYGEVKGYKPREAEILTPFTTLDGVFEKDTGRAPFNSPSRLRELWERKDFGVYGVNGTVPVNFLTTNDIIGGNSGSPVMNARGEEVGIAFDGNYEGLGNDFFYNPDLGRTISVDIRYVLFLVDKFGGAGWILKEMDIKGKSMSAKK